jgi:hypothetical protein
MTLLRTFRTCRGVNEEGRKNLTHLVRKAYETAPRRIRTSDLPFSKPMLYPTAGGARAFVTIAYGI